MSVELRQSLQQWIRTQIARDYPAGAVCDAIVDAAQDIRTARNKDREAVRKGQLDELEGLGDG